MVVMTMLSVIPTIAYLIARSTFLGNRSKNNVGGTILIGIGSFSVFYN